MGFTNEGVMGVAATSRTRKDHLYDDLREAILLGRLHAGERLTEERLAEQFHLSRTPVREVLSRLEAEGLVEQPPFRGARVRHFGVEEIRGIYDLRALLEGYAARRAATQLTPDALVDLRRCNDEFVEAADRYCESGDGNPAAARAPDAHDAALQRMVEGNGRFHGIIIAASGNPYLRSTLHGFSQLPLVYRAMQYYGPHGIEVTVEQHRELLDALEQHDPEWAEAVMRVHIYHGRDALWRHLDELAGEGDGSDTDIA